MAQILAIVTRLLGLIAELLGIAQIIRTQTDQNAQEHSPYLIEGIVTTAGLALANPTYGLAALKAAIDAIDTAVTVITPTPPGPPPSSDDNAAAIWSYGLSQQMANGNVFNASAAEWLYMLGHSLAIYSATEGVPDGRQPWYRLVFGGSSTGYSLGYSMSITTQARPDPPDFTQLRAGDTVLSFMQRTQPAYSWTGTGPSGVAGTGIAWKNLYGGNTGVWWRTGFTLPVSLPGQLAPVWPGIDYVTLGAPVALSADLELAGPMDGLLIAITTPPTGLGKFIIGDRTWWYRLGQIAFVSDNGEVEPWQYLAWDQSVYCPRQMNQAASALIRCMAGAAGTATPWVVT